MPGEALASAIYPWSSSLFTKTLGTLGHVDTTSPDYIRRNYLRDQEKRIAAAAAELQRGAGRKKLEDHIAILDNEGVPTARLLFHPTEPCLVACSSDTVTLWDWEKGCKRRTFSNRNVNGSRITSASLVQGSSTLLLTGSDDGAVRIWRRCFSHEAEELAVAWRAYPDMVPRGRGPGLVLDWQQQGGILIAAGDGALLMIWDVERELCVQGMSSATDAWVTSLCSDRRSGGTTTYMGCGDGKVRIIDHRDASGYSHQGVLDCGASYIVDVQMPLSSEHTLYTASTDGPIVVWDIRMRSIKQRLAWDASGRAAAKKQHRNPISSLAVHDYAPVVAVGSQYQYIKVLNNSGDKLSTIKFHDGFLGQRIGPVTALGFHPTETFLAAGGSDSIISIYAGEGGRIHRRA